MSINLIRVKGRNPNTDEIVYYPKWSRKKTTDTQKIAKIMARGSTFTLGECIGILLDLPDYMIDDLLEGNAVHMNGLGTFKLKVTGKTRKTKEEVNSVGAEISVVYEPDPALLSRLNNEREFEFVEKPTKEGEKDAEADSTDIIDTSTGNVVDTSTGTTVDTSTGTIDNNSGDDIPAGNG